MACPAHQSRKYFPERFKSGAQELEHAQTQDTKLLAPPGFGARYWPFGDPFIEKRKLLAQRKRDAERKPLVSLVQGMSGIVVIKASTSTIIAEVSADTRPRR